MSNFPNVLAAVEAREKHLEVTEGRDLWALADALIKDCGSGDLTSSRANNGSGEKLAQCAAMLEKKGYEYEVRTLRNIRDTGIIFPKARRHPGISMWVHAEAGSPDFMDWVIKKYGKKGDHIALSLRKLREVRGAALEIERKERAKKLAAAQTRLKAATSVAEAKKAKEEIAVSKPMPMARTLNAPRPDSPIQEITDINNIGVHIVGATKQLRSDLASLRKLGGVNPDFGDEMVEDCAALIEVTTQLMNFISGKDRSGLAVVEGGKKHA